MAVLLAMISALPLTAPAAAKRDKSPLDAACDPVLQASRRSTSAVGLLIGGFDANADGRIDRAELKSGTARMFHVADEDGNGMVSLIELSEWATVWLGGPSAVPGRFDFDRDQDDRISLAEFAAELDRRFNAFDTDRNNVVDHTELLSSGMPKNCVDGRFVHPAPEQRDGR